MVSKGRRGWYLGVRGVEWNVRWVEMGLFGRQLDVNRARRRVRKVFMNEGDQLAFLDGDVESTIFELLFARALFLAGIIKREAC